MSTSTEVSPLLNAVRDNLQELDLAFEDIGVNLIDATTDPPTIRFYTVDPEGAPYVNVDPTYPGIPILLRIWRERQVAYRRNLEVEDIYGEKPYVEKVKGGAIRSMIDVPFPQGTLALNSREQNAFLPDDIKILQEMAQVLSEGFQRMEDFRRLEQRNREVHYQAMLLKNIADAVIATDTDLRIVSWNEAAEKIYGWRKDEVVGKNIDDICQTEFIGVTQEEAQTQLMATSRWEGEVVQTTKEGKPTYISASVSLLTDAQGNFMGGVTVNRDITDRKRVERELLRLERLRAVGELSAGISHNLNNILTNVLVPAHLLKRKTDDPELLCEIDDIATSALRARDLVRELHLSVRNTKEESLHPVLVNQTIQQAVQTSRPRWKDQPEAEGISIATVICGEDVPPIKGTQAGLHDILTNLIFNSVDAMPEGGVITIETQVVDDQTHIIFSDTGTGMSEETKQHIFEPFFTTKMDRGTGLGLSTVYNRVMHWGGTIKVDSAPKKGTTFILSLPVWTEKVAKKEEKTVTQSTRSGRVLVVDDNELVGHLLSRLLRKYHEVEIASDGRIALELFAPQKFDAVLIDLGMPNMSGDQLLKRIKETDPEVSTVLITGWDLPDTDMRVRSFDFQLAKPFTDLCEIESVVSRAIALRDERANNAA